MLPVLKPHFQKVFHSTSSVSIACHWASIFVLPPCTCAGELHPLCWQWRGAACFFVAARMGAENFSLYTKSQSISLALPLLWLLVAWRQTKIRSGPTGGAILAFSYTHVWPIPMRTKCFSLSCCEYVCWKEAHPWAQGSYGKLFSAKAARTPLHLSCTKYEWVQPWPSSIVFVLCKPKEFG